MKTFPNFSSNRLNSIGWLALWTLCAAGSLAQTAQRPDGKSVKEENLASYSENEILEKLDSTGTFHREVGHSARLNGVWRYTVEPVSERFAPPTQWDNLFLAPFSVSTSLAGVAEAMGSENRIWLSHEFTLPCAERGTADRVLLRMRTGKNKKKSALWVNGRMLEEFHQGFDHAIYDITQNLNAENRHQIQIALWETSTESPLEGVKTESLWPDLQIEYVPSYHIQDLKIHANPENGFVTVDLKASVPAGVWTFKTEIGLKSGEDAPALASVSSYARNVESASTRVVLQVKDPLREAPKDTKPYQAKIDLEVMGGKVDSISVPFSFAPQE